MVAASKLFDPEEIENRVILQTLRRRRERKTNDAKKPKAESVK